MFKKPLEGVRTRAIAGTVGYPLGRLAARQALPLAVIAALIWLGWDRLSALDTRAIATALEAMSVSQWLTGLTFTFVSFWAVGRYDAVVHRLTATGVEGRAAVETGATAIAVAQTIGMGTLTGALVRWRLLPELGFAGAMRLSVAVSLSFLAGWAVLAALALLAVPMPVSSGAARLCAGAVLLVAATVALLSLLRPGFLPRGLGHKLPSLRAMATVLGLAALDTLAAGTVLWILLPDMPGLGAPQVLAAYLLALGAGLVLTTPGGVGPFEAALLALLPGVASEPLLAAIIAYRALYYALPAVIGALVLIRGPRSAASRAGRRSPAVIKHPTALRLPVPLDVVIDRAPRAEAALLRHGRLSLATDPAGRPTAMVAPTGQSLVMLSDPLAPDAVPDDALATLTTLARTNMRAPVLYKCGARLAAAARARGWRVSAVAHEAWLDPRGFTPAGSARSGLRRKLRKAEAAGITITSISPDDSSELPLGEMAGIATAWARTHGGERGFSMGTWAPGTLPSGRVYLAHSARGRLLGFITVHATQHEHTLDLMRADDDAPDGLMYLLVSQAIEAAGQARVPRFSLAAVSLAPAATDPAPLRVLRGRLETASGARGLRQFKQSFAPNWEPLYMAAPSLSALATGALDVIREITRGG